MRLTPMSARSLVCRVLPCACGIWWPHPNVRTAQIEVTLLGQMEVEHSGFELLMLFFDVFLVECWPCWNLWGPEVPQKVGSNLSMWSNAIDSRAQTTSSTTTKKFACEIVDSCELWWHLYAFIYICIYRNSWNGGSTAGAGESCAKPSATSMFAF